MTSSSSPLETENTASGRSLEKVCAFLLVLGCLFLFDGTSVPHGNEWTYLPTLKQAVDSSDLKGDWTHAEPDVRHFVFNNVFGRLSEVVPLTTLVWSGRVVCWVLILLAWFRIGDLLKLPTWMTATVLLLWFTQNQTLVAEERMLRWFEAKSVAYVCLMWSLVGFLQARKVVPSLLLGLTFSFHPAVGLWSGLATGGTLLLQRTPVKSLMLCLGCVVLTSLPGAVPAVLHPATDPGSEAAFQCLHWMGLHLDPASWEKRQIVAGGLLLGFLIGTRSPFGSPSPSSFLTGLACCLGLFFGAGLIAAAVGMYSLVALMPFRVFDVFIIPLFLLRVAECLRPRTFVRVQPIPGVLAVCGLMSLVNPIAGAMDRATATREVWNAPEPDVLPALKWVSSNTPEGTILVASPHLRESYLIGERALIASWWHNPAGRSAEWRERIEALTNLDRENGPDGDWLPVLDEQFQNLSLSDLRTIQQKYGGDWLLSKSNYELPVLFESNGYRVYDLSPLRTP